MNKLIVLIVSILFLNNCSFNKNSKISKEKELIKNASTNKFFSKELNPQLKLDLNNIKINDKIIDNKNNYGFQNYDGLINKAGKYKFSKFENVNQLNYKPIFLEEGLIFFDKKGSIIRYDNEGKVIWKKNHYSKTEKKLKPKLYFSRQKESLLIADNIAKFYSININTGELNWAKNNTYPFNSEIKNYKDKFFVVDYQNTLRCYFINDGKACWNLQTQESFTVSNIKYSLIIINDSLIFNNSIGDITAVDIETGLITWQMPTQSSSIINEVYNFKISKLVSDGKAIFFSNNKNEFYSIDTKTGTLNWINKINSNINPIISGDLIFTISNDGYLIIIEKNNGNIIRITDIYKNYKIKKRKNIYPVGFAIGKSNLFVTNNDGKIIVADVSKGIILKTEKVSNDFISEPFILNDNLFIIRNGSIIRYN